MCVKKLCNHVIEVFGTSCDCSLLRQYSGNFSSRTFRLDSITPGCLQEGLDDYPILMWLCEREGCQLSAITKHAFIEQRGTEREVEKDKLR